MRKTVLSILLGLGAISFAAPADAQVINRLFLPVEAARAAGRTVFAEHCMACHGKSGVAAGYAPSLINVIGRRAGSEPGFAYSPALKNAKVVWSDDTLTKWITNAPATIPGTQMPHVSITDPAERQYVIAYLKTLHR